VAGSLADLAQHPYSLPPLLGAAVQLAIGLFLFVRARELTIGLWFGGLAVASGLWALAVAVALALPPGADSVGRACACASFALIAVGGPLSLRFSVTLAGQRIRQAPFFFVSGVAIALLAAFPSLTQVGPYRSGGFWPRPCVGLALAAVASIPPMLTGIFVLHRAWTTLPPCRRRRQLGWALAASTVAVGGGMDILSAFVPMYPMAWATGSLAALILFYAIAQHRLMAMRTFAQEAALGVLGALLAAVALYAIASATQRAPLSSVALGATTFFLFVATRGWLSLAEPALAKVLGRQRRRIEHAVTEFERRSLDARDPELVQAQLADALRTGFDAELVTILSADRARDDEPILLDAAEAAAVEKNAPILRDLLDLDEPPAGDLLQALDYLHADALVPLTRDGVLFGLAVARGPGLLPADDTLTSDLVRLGEYGARALTNARLYQEVERRGRGLEAQVRARTGELEDALVELRNAQARLVEAERSSSLGLLVAGVSHEINNALNFMSANLPTLERYALASDQVIARAPVELVAGRELTAARADLPRTISTLMDTTRRTGAIVADLRKFARPDTERRLYRLDEGLDAALNLLRRRTDGRLDVARVYVGTPAIECYPGPLNQCFFNLLLNAVEAARSEVWVILRDVAGAVEVLISDDGEGLDAAGLELLFQPFYTTKPKAAGLGLTVARSVVERHGGSLHIASERGQGATVRVRLPARAPEPRRPTVVGEGGAA
jgi:signal transduction histidine kinase